MSSDKIIYEGAPNERDFFDLLNFHRGVRARGAYQQGSPSPSPEGVTTTYKHPNGLIKYEIASDDESGRPRRVRVTIEGDIAEIEARIMDAQKVHDSQRTLTLPLAEKQRIGSTFS